MTLHWFDILNDKILMIRKRINADASHPKADKALPKNRESVVMK
jgi:hypothetical protein